MKTILGYLKDYIKNELRWPYLGFLLLFWTVGIYANYSLDFENSILRSYARQPIQPFFVFLYYSFPFFVTVFAYAFFYKRYDFLSNATFWSVSLLGMSILTFNETFYAHQIWIEKHFQSIATLHFTKKCAQNLVSALIYAIPIGIYWKYLEKSKILLYGFSNQSFSIRPYLLLWIFLIPLIALVSFTPDFIESYPIYDDFGAAREWGLPEPLLVFLFELVYGLDFVAVEFFFRGFLVLALAETMGEAVIMPMVSVYCLFHFGKPILETISSIAGGTILGILAYRTRSIYGGICIHLGVAYTMELAAYLQKM